MAITKYMGYHLGKCVCDDVFLQLQTINLHLMREQCDRRTTLNVGLIYH